MCIIKCNNYLIFLLSLYTYHMLVNLEVIDVCYNGEKPFFIDAVKMIVENQGNFS
ncbi:hypothetical protein J2S14_000986 [Lederbergia wuyishanensis]|uniref:Uncharacterized protein n=1 Tax=Lederbergia wuyishanensis TaxID=1347903 RepID=A0ABU0D1D9_9BACI|nr:hypothetical protein [Lederbergia wuyishanensis]